MDNLVIKEMLERVTEKCLNTYNFDMEFEVLIPYPEQNCYAINFIYNSAQITVSEFDIQLNLRILTLDFAVVSFFHELMEDISELDIF